MKMMSNSQSDLLQSNYTIFIILIPYFSKYKSGIPGLQLADLLLLVFWAIVVITKKSIVINRKILFWPLLVFMLITIFNLLFIPDIVIVFDVLTRSLRFSLYVLTVIFLSPTLFSIKKAEKLIVYFGYVFTAYIFMQYALYFLTGIVLKGSFGLLELYTNEYNNIDYSGLYLISFFRPTSLFLEPAHYARYMLLSLSIVLFGTNKNFSPITSVIFTIGILASTSNIGFVLVLFIWIYYLIRKPLLLRKSNFNSSIIWMFLTFLLLIPIMYLLLIKTGAFRNLISRLTNFSSSSAYAARLSSYLSFFQEEPFRLFFGYGLGYYSGSWQSGMVIVLYGTGLLGMLVLLSNLFLLYCSNHSEKQRIILLLFIGLLFVDDAFLSVVTILYLSFLAPSPRLFRIKI